MAEEAHSQNREESDPHVVELRELLDAVHRLSDTHCSEDLYITLADILSVRLGVDAVAIFIYHPDAGSFSPVYDRGFHVREIEFQCDEAFLSELSRAGFRPLCSDSGGSNVPAVFQESDPEILKSSTWALLRMKDGIVGLVALDQPLDRILDDRFNLDFMRRICMHAAISINSCRLTEQHVKEKEDLDKTLTNLSLLYNIGRAMTYISDLKSLLKYILGQAIAVTNAEKGSIMLHDPDTNQLSVRVLAGMQDKAYEQKVNNNEIKCQTFRPGEGVAGKVFLTGEPIVVNRTQEDRSFVGCSASFADSIACIPMKVYDDIIGVINVTNKKNDTGFTEDDVEMLRAVADQAAISISKAQLWEMAINDSLTGLHVRRYFMAKLQDEIHRTQRYKKSLSVAMGDLDRFKSINDKFGHTSGDNVLKAVGAYLQSSIRDVDSIGRYGGEEFIMFLPETGPDSAHVLADRLRRGIARLRVGTLPAVTISLGIATFPHDGKTVEELVQKADAALYAAKENGRNRVVIYSEDIPLPENRDIKT